MFRAFDSGPRFWHSEVERRFDFSCGRNRVEVKVTTRPERTHHFSHRQIFAIEGEEIVVASIVAAEDDSGLSLRQLIDECRNALLGTPDYLKLEKAVRQAGMESSTEPGPLIDAAEAEQNLAWFRSIEYPPLSRAGASRRNRGSLQGGPLNSTASHGDGARRVVACMAPFPHCGE